MTPDPFSARFPDAREWTVIRHRHDRRHVIALFDGTSPAAWISRLRRLCPVLQQRSPSDLLAEVRRMSCIDFGTMEGRHAGRLVQQLVAQHFEIRCEDASFTSHFPTVAGNGHIIEDDAEAEAFCLQLIREGATVQDVEA